ncbi:MAG: hypothetical protein ACREBI_09065 [Nitrosotalea sp.]
MFSPSLSSNRRRIYSKGMIVNDLDWPNTTSCNGEVSSTNLVERGAVGFGILEGFQLKQGGGTWKT